jgi:20S proteasome subunit beta 1
VIIDLRIQNVIWMKKADGLSLCLALALAMSRDGSSGGVIRMAVITEKGVERLFVPGDKLPGRLI